MTTNQTTNERAAKFVATNKPTMIHIAVNGVWSARNGDGSSTFSYEKLDYHAGCREFLEGLRDLGIPFTFHGDKVL